MAVCGPTNQPRSRNVPASRTAVRLVSHREGRELQRWKAVPRRTGLPRLLLMESPESGPASDVVSRFYDRHPYPPPVTDLDGYRDRWEEPGRRRAEHHLLFPHRRFGGDLDVLVAGCGTSQAVRHAVRWPAGRVVGIDVSETSLRHSEELGRRYALDNLELHQLPIERVGELGRRFDLVVCTGVLHHLAHPDGGLQALSEVLQPDGAMSLMVYARYGRLGVEMMQEYARLLGIGTSQEQVRRLAEALREIPEGHPLEHLLRNSPDFRRVGAFADALLNPRERSYSVPELFDYLDGGGLVFERWQRQAPYRPQCGAPATTPHAEALAALAAPQQFAAMELFRGTMIRHSLIAHRSDHPTADPAFSADHELSPQAVPIRLPDTIAVEERLPPGAAAALINQTHTYTDLVLPIDRAEKRVYEAIDGTRSVAEIAAVAGVGEGESRGRLAGFLRKLWWYDQVVFDLSQPRSRTGSLPPPPRPR